jgi:hypothetical protein
LDRLDYEPRIGLTGDPCRIIEILNDSPAGLGRSEVVVCQLSEDSFFYCGGYVSSSFDLSVVAAVFSVTTRRWQELPNMPEGRTDAVAYLVDKQVVIFGGLLSDAELLSDIESASAVLCFDLLQNRWVGQTEHCIPNDEFLDGTHFASAKLLDGRIVFAGKSYINNHFFAAEYGPLFGESTEVRIFEPIAKMWSILPNMDHELGTQTGILLANGDFAVLTNKHFSAFDFNDQTWRPLPPCKVKGGNKIYSVTRLNQHMIVVVGTKQVSVYDELHQRWFNLPLKLSNYVGSDFGGVKSFSTSLAP